MSAHRAVLCLCGGVPDVEGGPPWHQYRLWCSACGDASAQARSGSVAGAVEVWNRSVENALARNKWEKERAELRQQSRSCD